MNDTIDYDRYAKEYKETGIVSVPRFISARFLENIRNELDHYPWWVYSVRPYTDVSGTHYMVCDTLPDDVCADSISNLESGGFCYRFRRSYGKHYDTCRCLSCRLEEFVKSSPVTDAISSIVGYKKIEAGEVFISNYSRGDFLSVHHDIGKGDIAATFSLSEEWNPAWGGILHFCDVPGNIYKSISPQFGSLNLFRLDADKGLDHFVSAVAVNKHRYTLTAWYTPLDN